MDSSPEFNTYMKEFLRKFAPVSRMTQRQAIKNFKILDLKVKKGTTFVIPSYAIHMNPAIFANPEGFHPERFSEESEEKHGYAY